MKRTTTSSNAFSSKHLSRTNQKTKVAKTTPTDLPFAKLQKVYRLKGARDIQLRIIFNLLLQIVEAQYGHSPENKQATLQLRRYWQLCEKNCASGKKDGLHNSGVRK
jgi:hypothetical protein